MNKILLELTSSIEDAQLHPESDGSIRVVSGPSYVTFSPMELAQIESGLVSREVVRSSIMLTLSMGASVEQALGSERQRKNYQASKRDWLN